MSRRLKRKRLDGDAQPCPAPEKTDAVAQVERALEYQFNDPSLLEEAMTHSSAAIIDPASPSGAVLCYQRLEFVGDAALGLAVSNFLFLTNPDLGPGPLSVLRAANISTEKLARVSVRHKLYPLLRRCSPRLDLQVKHFIESVDQEANDDLNGHGQLYGGSVVKAPKVLADIVEAISAAVYIDCNFNLETMWKVMRRFIEPIVTAQTIDEQPVTTLHEMCQRHGCTAIFKTWQKSGLTCVNVFVHGELVGNGSSEQKVIAKLNAARDALTNLQGGPKEYVLQLSPQEKEDSDSEERECKQKLNEYCSKKHWPKPVYKIEKEDGPAHKRRFMCSVQVEVGDCFVICLGNLKSKMKDAENAAAFKMLNEVLTILDEE